MSGGRMDDVITQDDLFRLVTRQRALNFKPGAEHLYSNSGYMLLAKVVERVGGKPFPVFMRERVFTPLGMRDTRVHMDHQESSRPCLLVRAQRRGGYRNSVLSYANASATSLFTTVEDLARWLENFHTGAVGGAAAREMQFTRGILTKGDTIDYALGVVVDRYRGQRRIGHGGADAGFRSYVGFFPEIDAGVIVLSNDAGFNTPGVASQVADVFLGDVLGTVPAKPAATNASAPFLIDPTARRTSGRVRRARWVLPSSPRANRDSSTCRRPASRASSFSRHPIRPSSYRRWERRSPSSAAPRVRTQCGWCRTATR